MKNHPDPEGYELIDSGMGRKLERFGSVVLDRPAPGVCWPQALKPVDWKRAQARFERVDDKSGIWRANPPLPASWAIRVGAVRFKLSVSDFGHLGIFPEQAASWRWLDERCRALDQPRVLNLFAYSGGSTLACALAGAKVTHVDASKPMVGWARENARLNDVPEGRVTWITEDVLKFCARELRRGNRYHGIILDPPSFGRGAKKEVFKIEEHLPPLLEQLRELMEPAAGFLLFSCHTPGFTPASCRILLDRTLRLPAGTWEGGEMLLEGKSASLPNGVFARWKSGTGG